MSKEVAASFLCTLARSSQLREEVATLAKKYGYRFSPNDLAELGLEDLCGSRGDDDRDDQLSDRGFGAIEVPA
jgi:hypothetical protein